MKSSTYCSEVVMNKDEDLRETKLSSSLIYDGRLLKVYKDKISLPSGKESTREYILHFGASAIVPLLDNGSVIVERQFRYPFSRVMLEIPAGKLDSKDEDRLEAAKRELKEETGYSADEWIDLGEMYPSVAYTTESISLFLARGLKKGEQSLDEDEFLNIEEIPLTTLIDMVMNGEIKDSKTQVALLKAAKIVGLF